MELREIRLESIENPVLESRFERSDEDVRELADSMAAVGLIQPIAVVRHRDGYRLVAGRRRLQAAALLGWHSIRAVVHEAILGGEGAGTLVENLQRQQLNAVEEAVAFQAWLEQSGQTQQELASRLGVSRAYVSKRLMLLGLDDDTLWAVVRGELPWSQALELKRVEDEGRRAYLRGLAVKHGVATPLLHQWIEEELHPPEYRALPDPGQEGGWTPPPIEPLVLTCQACDITEHQAILRAAWLCRACHDALEQVKRGEGRSS